MRRVLFAALVLIFMFAACAPQTPTEPPSIIVEQPTSKPPTPKPATPKPTPTHTELTPAQQAALTSLSESLGLSPDEITLVSAEAMDWPDGCLGVAEEGMMCTQVITPGFRVILEANGKQVEYRTNEDGSQIRPATVAFTWKREGGIAGFCDYVTVYVSGEVHGSSCTNGQSVEKSLSEVVSEDEIARLDEWLTDYSTIEIDASDPEGVSDRMMVTLTFTGTGSQESLSPAEQQELLEFAQSLNQELYQ